MRVAVSVCLLGSLLGGCVSGAGKQAGPEEFAAQMAQSQREAEERHTARLNKAETKRAEGLAHYKRHIDCSKDKAIGMASSSEGAETIAKAATALCSESLLAFTRSYWQSGLFGGYDEASEFARQQDVAWQSKLTAHIIRLRSGAAPQPENQIPSAPRPKPKEIRA